MSIHRAERKKYYKHGLKAQGKPEEYLSITIDGMDQNKTHLPHFNTSTKVKIILLKYTVILHYAI